MSDKVEDLLVYAFIAVTIGMIIAGPILALWFNNGNWLYLCMAIILYLS